DSRRSIPEHIPTRPQAGLPEQGLVFCSFNQSGKIAGDMFDVWMRLLARFDGSVLWLSRANEAATRHLRRAAQARGIERGRLIFAARTARIEEHLARHTLADLFLDTLPFNARSTAIDALWAGVPVVTCAGRTFAGRVAASLLQAVGLPDL